ncbi:alpha/beta hydrolase [Actinoplanes sp. NPDC051633]|uniref:alpha/beta fold hydrolase n=1 Tax=Actinoplanes sp. NPDC051633 TaxID=3155670 RepID=UPI0034460F5F
MSLEVHEWPATAPSSPAAPVVAVHGITANGLSWGPVAERLAGRVTLLAPDLRGRAGSRAEPGPYGLGRHADDLIALLDERGVDRAVFAGHSMGAYVAAIAASRHPSRVTAVVMVDGGLAFPLPAGTDVDALLTTVLGPAIARLDATFATRDDYREFWRRHPAFGFPWTPALEAYLMHDLVGDGPYRSSCVAEAIRVDGADMFAGPEATSAFHRLRVPAVLLRADRGLLDQSPGAYTAGNTAGLPVPAVRVPGTNHYSILASDEGAAVVADHILRFADTS